MDPITKVAQEFMQSWQRFRQSGKARLYRIDTDPSMHRDLWRIFRAIEMSPDNRSPYFIFDTPFSDPKAFFDDAIKKLAADYALIREGLSKDGVQVGELNLVTGAPGEPEAEFAQAVESVWDQVKSQFEYLLLIFLPQNIEAKAEWPSVVEKLRLLFESSKVRLAAADTPEQLLTEVCARDPVRSLAGKFFISKSALQDYLFKVAAGGWAGLASKGASAQSQPSESQAPAAPVTTTAGGDTSSNPPVPNVLAPEEAALLRTCMAKAATASADHKVEESIEALHEGRVVCHRNGLLTHEAILVMAMANTLLAAQKDADALAHYDEAIGVATRAATPIVVMQARMGAASVLFRAQNYDRAAESYEQASEDAVAAESDVMRIEALRMAGTCHNLQGRPDAAAACWNRALSSGANISLAEIDASTIDQIGSQFAAMCEKNGLTEQAKSVKQQIEAIRHQALLREKESVAAPA
jgi:tetratricopeptide (TPR) repeat protein